MHEVVLFSQRDLCVSPTLRLHRLRNYLNAVAGGNFAIINRLVIFEQVAEAFREVFGGELELIYEISHNQARNPKDQQALLTCTGAPPWAPLSAIRV